MLKQLEDLAVELGYVVVGAGGSGAQQRSGLAPVGVNVAEPLELATLNAAAEPAAAVATATEPAAAEPSLLPLARACVRPQARVDFGTSCTASY